MSATRADDCWHSGIRAWLELRSSGEFGPVVASVLSTYASDDDVYRAVQAGASGYLLKDMPLSTLVEVIRVVHTGQQFLPPTISARLVERLRQAVLSEHELTVLRAIAQLPFSGAA